MLDLFQIWKNLLSLFLGLKRHPYFLFNIFFFFKFVLVISLLKRGNQLDTALGKDQELFHFTLETYYLPDCHWH